MLKIYRHVFFKFALQLRLSYIFGEDSREVARCQIATKLVSSHQVTLAKFRIWAYEACVLCLEIRGLTRIPPMFLECFHSVWRLLKSGFWVTRYYLQLSSPVAKTVVPGNSSPNLSAKSTGSERYYNHMVSFFSLREQLRV